MKYNNRTHTIGWSNCLLEFYIVHIKQAKTLDFAIESARLHEGP